MSRINRFPARKVEQIKNTLQEVRSHLEELIDDPEADRAHLEWLQEIERDLLSMLREYQDHPHRATRLFSRNIFNRVVLG